MRREVVSLQAVVELALQNAQPLMQTAQHRVRMLLPQQPVWVQADTTRLAQAVANLLDNAARHTPEGGEITVRVTRRGDDAQLSVEDAGLGTPPELLEDVSRRFTQVDSTQHRAQSGLGIGLGLARDILHLHGGRIEAHSAGPGHGSRFVCTLPLAAGPGAAPPARPGVAAPPFADRGLRVMVADDNEDAAQTLSLLLQMWGHDARVATGGAQAIEMARDWAPELAFIDIGMPQIDGFEVVRRIRTEGCNAKLVALTGWGTPADQQRTQQAGFDHHLVKPVTPDELLSLLASCQQQV